MKNFIQDDDAITVLAPSGGVSSGDGVLVGALFGVASSTAAEAVPVVLATEGVYSLPKKSSATFASCGLVSWNVALKECDAPGTGCAPIGVAITAAGNGAATVAVRLNGTATVAA